jgi:hypothetical protein
METEAWFIADNQHFLKISNQLTNSFIKTISGLDVQSVDVESIDCPSDNLNEIYKYAGESYEKTRRSIKRTIDSLDLFSFFCILPDKIPSLKSLIAEIEN